AGRVKRGDVLDQTRRVAFGEPGKHREPQREGGGKRDPEADPPGAGHGRGASASGQPLETSPPRPGRRIREISRAGIRSRRASAPRASSESVTKPTPSAFQSSRMPAKSAAFERPST